MEEHIKKVMASALEKLRRAYEEGPGAPDVTLTAEEAVVVYRLVIGK